MYTIYIRTFVHGVLPTHVHSCSDEVMGARVVMRLWVPLKRLSVYWTENGRYVNRIFLLGVV